MSTQSMSFSREAMEQLRNVFNAHQAEMTNIARNMSKQMGGMGSMGMPNNVPGLRSTDNIVDSISELKRFLSYMRKNNQTLTATERYKAGAAKRELAALEANTDAIEKEMNRRRGLAEATGEAEDAQKKNTKEVGDSTKQLIGFAEKLVGGTLSFTTMTRAVNEFSQAYKQGFNWNAIGDSVSAAINMGMSPADMMNFQKRFRRVSNTFEGGIDAFNKTISESNVEWLHYTGSLKDAANAQGEFYDLALSMGTGAKDMKGAVGGMFAEFKKLQVATSMTAEEFVATQKSLLSEKSVRDKLVGLQGRERANYLNKLTDTAYMFQTLGLQKEAAEGMVKLIESQSSKTGVSRLREGAQLQMAAGILGMSGEDASNIQRLRSKRNLAPDEQAQLASLYASMSQRIESRKGAGGFQEYQMDAIEQILPVLKEIVNPVGGTMALASGAAANPAAIADQSLDIQRRDSGVYGVIKEYLVRYVNMFENWSQSALAAILALGVGKLAINGFKGAAGAPGAAAAGGGLGRLGAAIGKAGPALMKGGLIAGATVIGSIAIDQTVEDPEVKGGMIGALNGASLGATIGSFIAPGIGTAVGAAIGGLGGMAVGILTNQKTYDDHLDDQKKKLLEQTDLDENRYQMARKQYQTEIDQLTKKGQLSAAEDARLKAIQEKMDAATAAHDAASGKASVNQVGYQIDKQAVAKDWMAQSAIDIKRGGLFSNTSAADVKDLLAELRGKLSATGVNLTDDQIKARYSAILQKIAGESNDAATRNAGFDAAGALNGGSSNYNTKLANPMLAQAMTELSSQLSVGFSEANQATFATKISTPEAIAALQDQVKTTVDQMAKDRNELAALQSGMAFDQSGLTGSDAMKVQKRIDMNQQTLDALQQLASKDNSVSFQSEGQLLDVLKKLADTLDRNPPKRITP